MLNQCKRKQAWDQKRNKTEETTQNKIVNNKSKYTNNYINYK